MISLKTKYLHVITHFTVSTKDRTDHLFFAKYKKVSSLAVKSGGCTDKLSGFFDRTPSNASLMCSAIMGMSALET